MSIIRQGSQFHLQTEHTSYLLSVYLGKYPLHLYWGDRLPTNINLEGQIEAVDIDRPEALHVRVISDKLVFLSDLKKEFSTGGKGDYGIPTLQLRLPDGTMVTELTYLGYRITEGKQKPKGLPGFCAVDGDGTQTLELEWKTSAGGLRIVLIYSVLEEYDVIVRSIRYENAGTQEIHLLCALSMSVDFPARPMQFLQFPGDWTRERSVECCDVRHGISRIASSRGYSGHEYNPCLLLRAPDTTEDRGPAFGFSLVYSGNFEINVEKNLTGLIRVAAGINSSSFDWPLQPGEIFCAPETAMAYSARGMNGLSHCFHRAFLERLCPPRVQRPDRPVVINNWEGTGTNFTEQKLLDIMEAGADVGADIFVVDAGWSQESGNGILLCGDWTCNENKLPHGLAFLANEARRRGLGFGLWFEPEMMTPGSRLYEDHPDWCLHVKGEEGHPVYHRLILDYGRQEVCDYIVQSVSAIVEETGLCYIKWDCNRNFTETEDGAQAHRYMLGFYRVLEELQRRFPDVLFEGCSSGGGRFDAGILPYMPQSWTSDMARPYSRLFIQHGTSYFYPPISMTAHIGRFERVLRGTAYLRFSALAAMGGNFGLELDLSALTEAEKDEVRGYVSTYKTYRSTIQTGTFYRLESPFEGPYTSWEYVSRDRKEVVLLAFRTCPGVNVEQRQICLQGLEPGAMYRCDGVGYPAELLMKDGLFIGTGDRNGDYDAQMFVFMQEEKG